MVGRKIGWEPHGQNFLIGTEVPRSDGLAKVTGKAKFTSDINPPGTLIAKLLTCPHAHAKLVQLNIEKAMAVKGVKAVIALATVGDELFYEGCPVAAVAAERREFAEDGLRAIEVKFEPLPHFVDDTDLSAAEKAEVTRDGKPLKLTRALGSESRGDASKAIKEAHHIHKGIYGIRAIAHTCWEPHGSHAAWEGDRVALSTSTQNVSGIAGGLAKSLDVNAANIKVRCDNVGGAFESKLVTDEWDVACAKLAKQAGRPVRLMLNRSTEMQIAGNRQSAFADITVACDADGKVTAWESHHWGSNGSAGSTITSDVLPYVFVPKNWKRKATGIVTHCGPSRNWRAADHSQACALTLTALDDLAAKAGMDSLLFFRKNLDLTAMPQVYGAQLEIAAKLMDWKAKWHPRGKASGNGAVKRGIGMAFHRWKGEANQSTVLLKLHADGTIELLTGTQETGGGIRTCMAQVAGETFGLPTSAIKVSIGSNQFPQSGPATGSSAIGGISGAVRMTAQKSLWKIFDLVAARYKLDAGSLEASDGRISSGTKDVCAWSDAAGLIGDMPLEFYGGPVTDDDHLAGHEVGGVQMAEVSVDTETGIVKILKLVAVQDCGMIVNRLLARTQVCSGLIMGIASALTEERIVGNKTGMFVNANLVDYKLPRVGDVGELVVEFYEPDSEYQRGVIGLGDAPVISTGAAISNAVANAIGVRVPILPMTPKRVLETLKGANG